MNRFSIKSRVLIILLLVSITSVMVIGVLAYRYAQEVIRERIFEQLTSLRVARNYEIESYLTGIETQLRAFADNVSVSEATSRMRLAYRGLGETVEVVNSADAAQAELRSYYADEYIPRLAENLEQVPSVDTYLPDDITSIYLQYQYIADNPHPVGSKHELNAAGDGSTYSTLHSRYHPTFRNLVEAFNFYDFFLIDAETGDVIYSVYKEVDFSSNVFDGPFAGSGLGEVAREVRDARDPGFIALSDFDTYRPSYGAPAAFVATPVYRFGKFVGILALQFSIEEIDRIMTSGESWRESGLGETGQTYLAGPDNAIRSTYRLLREDPDAYFATLEAAGTRPREQALIRNFGSPVLLQDVSSEAIERAQDGETGTEIIRDFRDVAVLSAFAPLDVDSLSWSILAEMDLAEAYQPLYTFQRLLILSTVALIIFITALAMLLANLFTRPITQFVEGARAISSGGSGVIPVESKDEFGQLATSLNDMVTGLKHETSEERKKGERSANVLSQLLPKKVAQRLLSADSTVVERYPNVSVIFVDLHGFGHLSDTSRPETDIEMLNELITLFDEAAEKNGVEKVKTLGADYLAVCGAMVSRLDHARRTLDLARAMLEQISFFNQQHGLNLNLSIGIDSGTVVAGVIGRNNLAYDAWGKPVDGAMALAAAAEPGSILVAASLKETLEDELETVQLSVGTRHAYSAKPEAAST